MSRLAVNLGRLRLENPVMPAAGTFTVESAARFYDVNRLGAVVAKTVTLAARAGNPTPRVAETAAGMLNSVGLQNAGVEHFLREEMPRLTALTPPLIISIAGHTLDEFAALARKLDAVAAIAAIEVNVSCPNVACGGKVFAADAQQLAAVVAAVRAATAKYVIVKLSPNVGDMTAMALTAEAAGADCLCVANTLLGMKIDTRTRRPVLANIVGGLSGPAVMPVILRMVYQIAAAVSIPVIGAGGIATAEDALEYLLAGAAAVQVGTAAFANPQALPMVIEGLEAYLAANGIGSVADLIGAARPE
ncbi:MAG: dihydroorotate dehydrogenase [Sporomusaceae bacterium]|nr:dihydroorotate dehydrogenase [Sporomusaceae bacterium]